MTKYALSYCDCCDATMVAVSHPDRALTPAMLRELRSVVKYGQPGELAEYGANALAFYAREKTITALIRRGLIADAETATDAGRAEVARRRSA